MSGAVSVGKQLKLLRTPGVAGSLVRLDGIIDDSFERSKLGEDTKGITVFDLDGVSRITSYGVREWMLGLSQMPTDAYYCFARCRPAMVSQFNMVAGFGVKGELVSFYLPYLCPACDKNFEVLADLRKDYNWVAAREPPAANCPDCKRVADFDDVAEVFLEYVASAPQPSPPPRALAMLDGDVKGGAQAAPLRVEKEVQGKVTLLWLSGELARGSQFKRVADGLEGQVALLLSKVTGVQEDGLRGLYAVQRAPDIQLFFARVPLAIATQLAANPAIARGSSFISLLIPAHCPNDGTQSVQEVNASAMRTVPAVPPAHPCPKCHTACVLDWTVEQQAILRELPNAAAPPEIAELLRERPNGPKSGGAEMPPVDFHGLTAGIPVSGSRDPTLFGRYELVRRIGVGGMAEVFLARQRGPMGFEKRVVLKRILPHLLVDPHFVEMFLEEAKMAARINHANVVQIFDLGRVGDQYFIAMEHVHGSDLAMLLKASRELGVPVPIGVAVRIAAQMTAGLHAAHSTQDDAGKTICIIHRDVSPHNVLVSVGGEVKVTDFGIARVADRVGDTDPDVIKGKIAYIAPELFSRSRLVEPPVDVFSAGVVFFQVLTQRLPFQRDTDAGTMNAILTEPTPSLREFRPDAPAILDGIVNRVLAKDPAERYQTARDFQLALEHTFASIPGSTAPHVAEWANQILENVASMGGRWPTSITTLSPTSSTSETGEIQTRDKTLGPSGGI